MGRKGRSRRDFIPGERYRTARLRTEWRGVIWRQFISGEEQQVSGKVDLSSDDGMLRFVVAQRYARDSEFLHTTHQIGLKDQAADANGGGLTDFLFVTAGELAAKGGPSAVFDRMRWGGQVVIAGRKWSNIVAMVDEFAEWRGGRAWALERRPVTLKQYRWGMKIFGGRSVHYFVARKVMLIEPGQTTDRFTYHVYLERNAAYAAQTFDYQAQHWRWAYDVVKQVPTMERVFQRLREKFPNADEETLKRRSRKFTEKIFPVFLTREAALLKLLQRDLPEQFRSHVPRVVETVQDDKGYVQTLRMNWLRNGGKLLSQLEFAKQSAELLTALHDAAKVMHLDLRLDNFVITERGVGFVDFGSAVRVGEDFPEASLLSSLFGEMMRTSQIQRMLGRMTETGQVTSEEITSSHHKIDKAVDFFYLAVQINAPHNNPDFRGLVKYDPNSREAEALKKLTEEILRPSDPANSRFKSARDILDGILEIERQLKR